MFAVSDFEPDVPGNTLNFVKKAVKGKKENVKKLTSKTDDLPKVSPKNSKNKKKKLKPNLNSNSTKSSDVKNKFKSNTSDKINNNVSNDSKNFTRKNNDHRASPIKPKNGPVLVKKNLTKGGSNGALNKSAKRKAKKKKINQLNEIPIDSPKPSSTDLGELSLSGENPRKRKINDSSKKPVTKLKKVKTVLESSIESMDITHFESDKPDEVLIEKKKKQINDALKNDDQEDVLFSEANSKPRKTKKDKLKKILDMGSQRNSIKTSGSSLRDRMMEKLKSAQFRYLNEKLYTSSGSEAMQLFQSDPSAFQTYHQGYQQQLKKWPVSPLDIIVKSIKKLPKTALVADMGCGEANLAKRVPHKVRSFDLVATAPGVETCDMAHTPLLTGSVDAAVYCLALMGTDLTQYLVEANRVLKQGGQLLIAEVESRFDDVDAFAKEVQRLGFKLTKMDKSHTVFFFMEFKKMQEAPSKKAKLPVLSLKPCLYKRR